MVERCRMYEAPEIIYSRADHTKDHMGLQTWKNAPDGRVLLSDTKIAKNYRGLFDNSNN